jgi:GST-like protein
VYLAEKFGEFLPTERAARAETLSWLFWQMGSAPYLGGGFGHFYAYAPTKIEYAIDRFAMETKRQLDVLDRRLGETAYLAGDAYTIADIAVWPWYGGLAKGLLYGAGEFLSVKDYKNVQRWADVIGARPAVKRGRIVTIGCRRPLTDSAGGPDGALLRMPGTVLSCWTTMTCSSRPQLRCSSVVW